MPTTFSKIGYIYVSGSSTYSVTFSSIPQSFTDLVVYISARTTASSDGSFNTLVQINSQSTASNYTGGYSYYGDGDGFGVQSSSTTTPSLFVTSGSSNSANVFSNNSVYISNYTAATANEILYAGGNQDTGQIMFGNARPNTAEAVTSITLLEKSNQNFVEGTTFYLYGIKNS